MAVHRMFYLSALGRLNSDAHTPGTTLQTYRMNKCILGWSMEKAHAGSGASFSGINLRNGDLLTLFVKNAGFDNVNDDNKVKKCQVTNHFEVIARISAQGCDLLD